MISSIDQMVAALENAAVLSTDPVDEPFFNATSVIHTGRRGRPRINIDSELLAVAFELPPRAPAFTSPEGLEGLFF